MINETLGENYSTLNTNAKTLLAARKIIETNSCVGWWMNWDDTLRSILRFVVRQKVPNLHPPFLPAYLGLSLDLHNGWESMPAFKQLPLNLAEILTLLEKLISSNFLHIHQL